MRGTSTLRCDEPDGREALCEQLEPPGRLCARAFAGHGRQSGWAPSATPGSRSGRDLNLDLSRRARRRRSPAFPRHQRPCGGTEARGSDGERCLSRVERATVHHSGPEHRCRPERASCFDPAAGRHLQRDGEKDSTATNVENKKAAGSQRRRAAASCSSTRASATASGLAGVAPLDVFGDIFNTTNHVNHTNPSDDRRNTGGLPEAEHASWRPRDCRGSSSSGFASASEAGIRIRVRVRISSVRLEPAVPRERARCGGLFVCDNRRRLTVKAMGFRLRASGHNRSRNAMQLLRTVALMCALSIVVISCAGAGRWRTTCRWTSGAGDDAPRARHSRTVPSFLPNTPRPVTRFLRH